MVMTFGICCPTERCLAAAIDDFLERAIEILCRADGRFSLKIRSLMCRNRRTKLRRLNVMVGPVRRRLVNTLSGVGLSIPLLLLKTAD